MPLPENFESLWKQAASEESFQTLVSDLESCISDHWGEDQENIENVLLSLLERGSVAGIGHLLKAMRSRFPLNLNNGELIKQVVRLLHDPSPEIRLAAIQGVGRLASESDDAPGQYLSHLMTTLKIETDTGCRNQLLVYAETSISDAQTKLANLCLAETADKERGPWREMLVLGGLQKLDVKFRDWRAFLEKLNSEMEAWDNLGWMAFRALCESVSPDSSLYRELVERIPELMRIADVVEEKHEFETNLQIRIALIELIRPMSRRRKKKIVNQKMGFLANAINYNDAGINMLCLEVFLELSIVPLLSIEQRTNLLTHENEMVRELAAELFIRDSEGPL